MVSTCKSWTRNEYPKMRIQGDRLMKSFHQSFCLLIDYQTPLKLARNDTQIDKERVKRRERTARGKVLDEFYDWVPQPLAEHVTSVLLKRGQQRFVLDSSADYQCELMDDTPPHNGFNNPRTLFNDKRPSHWHKIIQKAYVAIKDADAEKALKGAKQLPRDEASHGVKLFRFEPLHFNIEGPPKDEPFQLQVPLDPVLTIQIDGTLSISLGTAPFVGLANFLLVTTGYAYIIMIEIETLLKYGGTIDTIPQCLEDSFEIAQEKCAKFSINVGKACFVPLGVIPIVIGIGPQDSEIETFTTYVQFFFMDTRRASAAPKDVKSEVQSYLTRSSSRRTNIWNVNQLSALKAFGSIVWDSAPETVSGANAPGSSDKRDSDSGKDT